MTFALVIKLLLHGKGMLNAEPWKQWEMRDSTTFWLWYFGWIYFRKKKNYYFLKNYFLRLIVSKHALSYSNAEPWNEWVVFFLLALN